MQQFVCLVRWISDYGVVSILLLTFRLMLGTSLLHYAIGTLVLVGLNIAKLAMLVIVSLSFYIWYVKDIVIWLWFWPCSSSNVQPLVIAAHPHEPNQFALGLSDGGVHVFEPLESEGKWGVPPPVENGSASSVPTAAVGGSGSDQAQR